MLALWKESYDKPRQHVKKQSHHVADKGPYSQNYDFSSSHVWMWELDHKEGRVLKNWHFWIVVLEKTLQSLLDCKEITPVNLKGNKPWILIGRTVAEVPTLMQRTNSLEKTLGKTEGKRKTGKQRLRWLDSIIDSMEMNFSQLQEIVEDTGAWHAIVHGVTESDMTVTEQ